MGDLSKKILEEKTQDLNNMNRLEEMIEMVLETIDNADIYPDYDTFLESCANHVIVNELGCQNDIQSQKLLQDYKKHYKEQQKL